MATHDSTNKDSRDQNIGLTTGTSFNSGSILGSQTREMFSSSTTAGPGTGNGITPSKPISGAALLVILSVVSLVGIGYYLYHHVLPSDRYWFRRTLVFNEQVISHLPMGYGLSYGSIPGRNVLPGLKDEFDALYRPLVFNETELIGCSYIDRKTGKGYRSTFWYINAPDGIERMIAMTEPSHRIRDLGTIAISACPATWPEAEALLEQRHG